MDPVLTQLAIGAIREVWSEIDDRIADDLAYKRANPCAAATFHRVVASTLPRWRWLSRFLHRQASLRWAAWCSAAEQHRCDEAAKTATAMVRKQVADRKAST